MIDTPPELKTSETSENPRGGAFRERIVNVTQRRAGDIERNPRNPKRYTDEKQKRLTAVLSQFGKAGVLLTYIDNDGIERFFDGNTRQGIDPDETWWVAQTDFTQDEVDGLVMLYDPLAAPDWEAELLKVLVQDTRETLTAVPDLAAMVDEIMAELGAGLAEPLAAGDAPPQTNRAEELREEWGTAVGQMWRLPSRVEGQEHRLICRDCTDAAVVDRVMGGDYNLMTDPPYGIDAANMTMGDKQSSLPKEARLSNVENWDSVAVDVIDLVSCAKFACVWGGQYLALNLPKSDDWLCWDKKIRGVSFSEFELAWTNFGTRCRILQHHWSGEEKQHITQKPLPVITWAMRLCPENGLPLFDPFVGSGTTIIAAENLSRQCRAVEISPAYCAVILQRYFDSFGIRAELIT